MVRSTQVIVDEWPMVRLAVMAILVAVALKLMQLAARLEPNHPGSVFLQGRVPCLRETLLGSFGPVGRWLSKKENES